MAFAVAELLTPANPALASILVGRTFGGPLHDRLSMSKRTSVFTLCLLDRENPAQPPAGFIENIGYIVPRLGNVQPLIIESASDSTRTPSTALGL